MSGNDNKGEETVATEESQHVDDHSHSSTVEKDAEEEVQNSEETNNMKPTEEAQGLDENPELDGEEQRELVIEDCTEDEDRMVGNERNVKRGMDWRSWAIKLSEKCLTEKRETMLEHILLFLGGVQDDDDNEVEQNSSNNNTNNAKALDSNGGETEGTSASEVRDDRYLSFVTMAVEENALVRPLQKSRIVENAKQENAPAKEESIRPNDSANPESPSHSNSKVRQIV